MPRIATMRYPFGEILISVTISKINITIK